MWTCEALEATMDIVERGTCSLRRAIRSWNIPLSSLSSHMNGKTRFRKMGLKGVLTNIEDVVVIKWTLDMLKCGLSINLQ
jgi:hypothetical protein